MGEQQAEGSSEDPKTLARNLIREGVDPAEIAERTGLSQSSVNGLKGVLRKTLKKVQGELAATEDKVAGSGNVGEQEIIVDMKKEAQIASGAVTLARSQQRLKSLDSKAYQDLYGGGQQPEGGPAAKLIDLEIIRQLRDMRLSEEHRNNGGGAEATETLNLRKEIDVLKEEMRKKDLEDLKAQIVELRADLRSSAGSTSDLAVVVREGRQLLEKAITSPGPLRTYLIPDQINIKKPGDAPKLQGQTNSAILETLRSHGLVTRIPPLRERI